MENRSYEPEKTAKDVSLQELRDRLAEFARVRGWEQYHSPRNLLLALVINQNQKKHIYINYSITNFLPNNKQESVNDHKNNIIHLTCCC